MSQGLLYRHRYALLAGGVASIVGIYLLRSSLALPSGPPSLPPGPPPPAPKTPSTTGSQFLSQFADRGAMGILPPTGKTLYQWEAAVIDMAKAGDILIWPWTDVTLTDGDHTAVIKVQNDLFSIGTPEDHLRMPLRPETAQSIANLNDWMLPTPWLSYQIWKAAPYKLTRSPMVPNRGAVLADWAKHNATIDKQLSDMGASPMNGMVTGQKKDVVISNTYNPKLFGGAGNVVIYGWYNPAPDVFDDHGSINDPKRQPQQPNSGGAHDANYLDYSHGIRFIQGMAKVDGKDMPLADLYQHPTLSSLVSKEGPIKIPRYKAPIPPRTPSV